MTRDSGPLTPREWEVFDLIGEGMENREIAMKLWISVKTVEAHRTHLREKLGCKTGNRLLRRAMEDSILREYGLIPQRG